MHKFWKIQTLPIWSALSDWTFVSGKEEFNPLTMN